MRQHQDGREGDDEYCAGETRLCACVRARVREIERESTDGGGKNQRRREGGYAARQRQTIMHSKLRTYQRRAKGTGRRIGGWGHACTAANKEMSRLNVNTAEVLLQRQVHLSVLKDSSQRFPELMH